jgi:phosphoserine phosphatase
MRAAALFDLDHTVLVSDTGMSWMRFQRRRGELSSLGLARAVWWSVLYKAAVLDLEALATRLTAELAGQPEAAMREAAAAWYQADVVPMISPAARHAIAAHRAAGDVIALATGATQYAAESVAAGLGIEHTLCSRLEVQGGTFTGRLAAMCFGAHKVPLAEAFARPRGRRSRALDVLLRQLQRSAAPRRGSARRSRSTPTCGCGATPAPTAGASSSGDRSPALACCRQCPSPRARAASRSCLTCAA